MALPEYAFGAVLVDPPRAGLDATTLDLVAGYDHIVYISCNPTVGAGPREHGPFRLRL